MKTHPFRRDFSRSRLLPVRLGGAALALGLLGSTLVDGLLGRRGDVLARRELVHGGGGCQHDSMERRTAHSDCVVGVAIVPMPLHYGLLWELLKKGLGRHVRKHV